MHELVLNDCIHDLTLHNVSHSLVRNEQLGYEWMIDNIQRAFTKEYRAMHVISDVEGNILLCCFVRWITANLLL